MQQDMTTLGNCDRYQIGETRVLLRKDTFDLAIAHSVFSVNEYDLPASFSADDTIIDVGAHIGLFSLAAMQRGAGRVIAIEPDPGNHALATINLAPWLAPGKVDLRHGAVWRSDRPAAALALSEAESTPHGLNTGSKYVVGTPAGAVRLPTFPLDELIADATTRSGRPVALLKLDCEGSEWPILATSRLLHMVQRIAGEFHCFRTGLFDADELPPFTPAGLSGLLEDAGFIASMRDVVENGRQGLFFAENSRAIA